MVPSSAQDNSNNNNNTENTKAAAAAIPTIQLDDVNAFRDAFERYGFAVVPLDDSSSSLLPRLASAAHQLRAAAYEFFRSDVTFKQEYATPDGTYGPPGWAAQGLEAVARSYTVDDEPNQSQASHDKNKSEFQPDAVESFVYHPGGGNDSNSKIPPMLQGPLQSYQELVHALLLDQVMPTCAQSQNVPADFFDKFYQDASCSLRIAYYPAGSQSKYGAHTDYTGFTLLNTEKSGLQVLYDQEWIPVPSAPNQLIINAGDLLPVWTNGRFKSAYHRVVCTPELQSEDRLSLVYFTGPSDRTWVEPIVQPGETAQFAPVNSGEHLRAKLASTNK